MIADLKPYPAMKDSGVEWLGEVPEHWEVQRTKGNVTNVVDQTLEREKDDAYIALEHVQSWTGRISDAGSDVVFDSQVKRFRRNDVLFGKLRPYLAKVARPVRDGVCVGEFLILRADEQTLTSNFLEQLMRSKPVIDVISASTFGAKMPRADWQFIGSLPQALPPLPEQAAIVRYLDYVDRRVRRLTRAKRKLIALLTEQKHAIIHRAVTRGLDPDVSLKDSGVEWLGEVPEHWEVVPYKRRIGFQEGPGIMAADFRDSGVPLLRISCLRSDSATLDGCNYLDPEQVASRWSHFAVNAGDYLLSASGSTGAVTQATDVVEGSIPYTGIIRLWPAQSSVDMRFITLFMSSQLFQDQILVAKTGVGIEHFGPTHLKEMLLLLPPPAEQQAIVERVSTEQAPIDTTITRTNREIELLNEYRTRLIADVVTGKLDVRDVAAALPEIDPLDTEDYLDDALETDAEAELDDLDAIPEEAEA